MVGAGAGAADEELESPPPPQATKSIEANPISNEIFILTIENSIGLYLLLI